MSMGLIVRTAGLQRTKVEIKRDFDYLARLWDEIREKTLKSSAPALVYQDSDLIKRAIRDIYNRDIDEVIVEGEEGYRDARQFMKLLMPSHVKRVKHYADPVPLFQRYGAEDQLSAMYQPLVQLKSGGYVVINPTEALVSIDINSGRSTREHNIEQTAYSTNIEAANEIARQLRLRDMAGLVVIDFIDMESNGHIRKVEKAMKDALKNDRARIQVGRISSFGLMEMSRQRLRTGVLEASTRPCPHCEGTGLMRTASSAGLSALRMLEEEAARGRGSRIVLRAGREAAVYLLNKKRAEIGEVEARYGVMIEVLIDESFEGARMSVESHGPPPVERPRPPVAAPVEEDDDLIDEVEEEEEPEEDEAEAPRESRRRERSERGERGAPGRRPPPPPPRPPGRPPAGASRRRGGRGAHKRGRVRSGRGARAGAGDRRSGKRGAGAEGAPPSPRPQAGRRGRDRRSRRDRRAEAAPSPNRAPEPEPSRRGGRGQASRRAPQKGRGRAGARAEAAPAPVAAPRRGAAAGPPPTTPSPARAAPARPRPRRRRPRPPRREPEAGESGEDDEDGGPAPSGWWQRTFGA